MKTPIQQVDSFIEDLVEGNIESYIAEYMKLAVSTNLNIKFYQNLTADLHTLIDEYQKIQTPEEKNQVAIQVLDKIIACRFSALLKNNPNTVKGLVAERDFYKSRTDAAEERVKDLEVKLVQAYTAIDNMMQRFEKMGLKDKGASGGS
jgi:hypothetical protein